MSTYYSHLGLVTSLQSLMASSVSVEKGPLVPVALQKRTSYGQSALLTPIDRMKKFLGKRAKHNLKLKLLI